MAQTAKGSGRILAGDQFDFTLDGLASAAQMERLISSISVAMGGSSSSGASGVKSAIKRNTELNKKLNDSTAEAIRAQESLTNAKEQERKQLKKLQEEANKFNGALRSLSRGNIRGALEIIDTAPTKIALGVGLIVGSLTGYADKLTEGLQRGISGGIFDFAIAAKTAGISIEQFSKAIAATDGGFASLGVGATDGAKQFGALVSSVRQATAGVGNLGMTNEQLAMFTAQQTKTAISQGFKGKAAQEVVIKNSRALGDELDTLANRTGKSVMELAAAAMKLAQDPIVANFVQTSKRGGAEISKAVQQFGASLRGMFGEAGDTIASDVLKSALGGLPLTITQTGKNMIVASSAVYNELERQAALIKNGGEISAADQEKLRNTVIKEVEARGAELRMLANLEGVAGDSAKQLLALAEQANFYNSAAGARRREEDKSAQQFNAQIRQLQANMQKLAVPFLAMINTIDWSAFIAVLGGFANAVGILLSPLTFLGELIGSKNLAGTLVGGLFGLVAVAGLLFTAQSVFGVAVKSATMALVGFAKLMNRQFPGSGSGIISNGRGVGGRIGGIARNVGPIAGASMLGAGVSYATLGAPQSTGGDLGSLAGGIGGAMLGRIIGTSLGAFGGPIGMAVGSIAGSMLGQFVGDKFGGTSSELAEVGSENIGSENKVSRDIVSRLDKTNKLLEDQAAGIDASATYGARQTALLGDSVRYQRTAQMMDQG